MTDRDVQTFFKPPPPPPKRRAPGSTLPAATGHIPAMSQQRKTALTGWADTVAALKTRAGGRCEMGDHMPHAPGCDGVGTDPHHITPRSLGGSHTLGNLLWLNRLCHSHIEEHPITARNMGVSKGINK